MKVHWTETAVRHLTSIHDHIAGDSPFHARATVDRLTGRSEQLGRFPRSGRVVPEFRDPAVREVIEGAYRIIYRVGPDRIDVLALLHSARLFPWKRPPSGSDPRE